MRVQPHVPKKPKIVQKRYKHGTKMERKCIQKSIRDHVQKRFAKKSVFEANMAPKRVPRWVLKPSFERPRWDKKPYEFVHFLEKRSRCHRDPSEDPFWSPNGPNWEPFGDPKRCKIGQKIETQRFVPDASGTNRCVSNTRLQNGCSMAAKEDFFHLSDFRRDCFPFCFRSLNSASRLLAVKGFF